MSNQSFCTAIFGYEPNTLLSFGINLFVKSGNAGSDKATGEPIIFDPASYFGHNEAE